MPFNPSPTGYFPGVSILASGDAVTNSGVFLPYSSLPNFSPASSGDIRQLVYAFVESVYDEYNSLATADKPAQLAVNRTAIVPSGNILRNTYVVTVNLAYSGLTVVSE